MSRSGRRPYRPIILQTFARPPPSVATLRVSAWVELQQIAKRRPAIPVLGNVQLARRLAQPSLAYRKQPPAQLFEPHPTPQGERQVDIAKLARALNANALQSNRRRQMLAAVVEQRRFFRDADQPARKRARLHPSVLIELAKVRHRLLDHPPSNAHAAHQAPIAMNLAVLLANRMAQVHAPSEPTAAPSKIA